MTDKPAATGSGEPKCPKCGNGNVNIRTTNFINSDEFDPHVASGTEAHCYSSSCGYDGPVAEFMPTPPVNQPTVTLDRETFDHVRDYILPIYESRETIMAAVGYHDFAKDKCSCGGCWLYRQLERLGNALALLRAAEQK